MGRMRSTPPNLLSSGLRDGLKRGVGRCGASQISGIKAPNTGCIKLPQTEDSTA